MNRGETENPRNNNRNKRLSNNLSLDGIRGETENPRKFRLQFSSFTSPYFGGWTSFMYLVMLESISFILKFCEFDSWQTNWPTEIDRCGHLDFCNNNNKKEIEFLILQK